MRYQDILKTRSPKEQVKHLRDVFVWHPAVTREASIVGRHEIVRATYYTYAIGDESKQAEINSSIKSLDFDYNPNSKLPNNLYPYVLRKIRNKAAKGVDIKMTLDIILHANNGSYDTVLLVSGDGDYLPVIEEVMRTGKQVYLAAFSSGLNSKLRNSVDYFIDLDELFFE